MSVSYTIDSKREIVFTNVVGVIDGAQLYEHQNKLRNDSDFHPNMRELMDCLEVMDAELRSISYSVLRKKSPWGSNSKRAIVVSNVYAFGLLRIFQSIMSDDHGVISMFRDIDSAKNWLDL